jgi:hypothetical protein
LGKLIVPLTLRSARRAPATFGRAIKAAGEASGTAQADL